MEDDARWASGRWRRRYEFSLGRHVPADRRVCAINRVVDLSKVRTHLRPFYRETGRPSVDPELMIRMLLISHCFGIRSEGSACPRTLTHHPPQVRRLPSW